MEDNIASYEASSFAVNASKLQFDKNGLVVPEDFPAFVHEWWHYMQDITTITGQNGFYLWMRDIVRMTNLTCTGVNKTISIPLQRDQYEEVYSKYRRIYNIFCGKKEEFRIPGAKVTNEPTVEPNGISLDGEIRTFAKCTVYINDKPYFFGLLVLQELNAYYAQKIAELYVAGTNFNVPADSLPEFPYKMGDILFDHYNIKCDLRSRFIITMRVLDSLQAPAVFLKLLLELSNKELDYSKDRDWILETIERVSNTFSHKNEEAINEWMKDYSNWMNDTGHSMLRESLIWYISILGTLEKCAESYGIDTFELVASSGIKNLNQLYGCFPAPLIKRNGEVLGQSIYNNKKLSIAAQHDFECALVIWSHRRIYDLLRSEDSDSFQENAECPLYNNGKCLYLNKYATDKPYLCKMAPWEVVKGEKQALCPYAVAAHSMGLWQNDLDVKL